MAKERYVVLQEFMRRDLCLCGNELIAYAIIYGFCQGGEPYRGSASYIETWTGCSKATARRVLTSLQERGLITKKVIENRNQIFNEYMLIENLASTIDCLEPSDANSTTEKQTPVPPIQSDYPLVKLDTPYPDAPLVKLDTPLVNLDKGVVNLTTSTSKGISNSSILPIPPSPILPELGIAEKDGKGVDRISESKVDPEIASALHALMVRSINQRAPYEEVFPAYQRALDAGYTPEQIDQGYTAYIARYREKHPANPHYAMRLSNYLTRGDGLPFDEPKPRATIDADRPPIKSKAEQMRDALTKDADFARLWDRAENLANALLFRETKIYGDITQEDVDDAWTKAHSYFDSMISKKEAC